jgi:hypothetical protein
MKLMFLENLLDPNASRKLMANVRKARLKELGKELHIRSILN